MTSGSPTSSSSPAGTSESSATEKNTTVVTTATVSNNDKYIILGVFLVVGVFVIITVIVVILLCMRRRRLRREQEDSATKAVTEDLDNHNTTAGNNNNNNNSDNSLPVSCDDVNPIYAKVDKKNKVCLLANGNPIPKLETGIDANDSSKGCSSGACGGLDDAQSNDNSGKHIYFILEPDPLTKKKRGVLFASDSLPGEESGSGMENEAITAGHARACFVSGMQDSDQSRVQHDNRDAMSPRLNSPTSGLGWNNTDADFADRNSGVYEDIIPNPNSAPPSVDTSHPYQTAYEGTLPSLSPTGSSSGKIFSRQSGYEDIELNRNLLMADPRANFSATTEASATITRQRVSRKSEGQYEEVGNLSDGKTKFVHFGGETNPAQTLQPTEDGVDYSQAKASDPGERRRRSQSARNYERIEVRLNSNRVGPTFVQPGQQRILTSQAAANVAADEVTRQQAQGSSAEKSEETGLSLPIPSGTAEKTSSAKADYSEVNSTERLAVFTVCDPIGVSSDSDVLSSDGSAIPDHPEQQNQHVEAVVTVVRMKSAKSDSSGGGEQRGDDRTSLDQRTHPDEFPSSGAGKAKSRLSREKAQPQQHSARGSDTEDGHETDEDADCDEQHAGPSPNRRMATGDYSGDDVKVRVTAVPAATETDKSVAESISNSSDEDGNVMVI